MVKLDEAFTKRGTKRIKPPVSEPDEKVRDHDELEAKLKQYGLRTRRFEVTKGGKQ